MAENSVPPIRTEIDTIGIIRFMRPVDAGDRGQRVVAQRHQRSVGNPGIAAGGRKGVAAHPRVHVGDHGAPEIFDRERRLRLLPEQIAFPSFGRERAGKMLQAGEVIDADVFGERSVVFAVGAGVNERGGAAPIFVRSVGEKNPGHDFVGDGAVEQARRLSGDRICLGLIGEGKDVGGEKDGRGRLRVARRLGETVVEAAAARSGDVGENAVERDPSLFVGIETLIEKVAQEAAVLRNAFAVDAGRGSDGIGSVLGIGGEVANRGEAAAGDDGVGDDINVFVNLARLKTAVQMDMPVAGCEFAVDGVGKLPFGAGNDGALSHRESRRTVSTLRGSSGAATGYSVPPMLPMMRCPSGISGIIVEGMRSPRSSPVMVFPFSFAIGAKNRSASAPSASHCQPRLTMVKPLRSSQASPASVARSQSPPSTRASDAPAPAVGNFQKHRAVALARVLRTDGDEVGREFDLAVFQVHRVAEIDDALVVRIGHRQREVDAPGDALVGSGVAEWLAVKHIVAGGNFDAKDARVERDGGQGKEQKEGRSTETQSHAGKHSTQD